MPLHYVQSQRDVIGTFSSTVYGQSQTGCCSTTCYQAYWVAEVGKDPSKILTLPYIPVFTPEAFNAHMLKIISKAPHPTAEDIDVLFHYMDKPIAQGVTMMYMGFKNLDHSNITNGLKLCRNDPVYEKFARQWVDNLATDYVADLRRLDVPTSRTTMGGVTITLSMPKGQSEMKLHACPSCGAGLDKVAVRGQTVKCSYCNSSFEVT
jgi:hypothetical protein